MYDYRYLTMEIYDKIARYYDLTHDALSDDIDYLLSLSKSFEPRVLELGCGSGRLLLPLAQNGLQVTGIDSSKAMLSRAELRVAQASAAVVGRIRMLEADMTSFELTGEEGRYGLVIIPYNTFMHLDADQKRKALKRVSLYLHPSGQLFIDLINPVSVAQTPNDRLLTLENQLIDPESGDLIVQMASSWLDETAQVLNITWIYDSSPASGGAVSRVVADAQYHYLFPHQVELLLQDAGLKMESIAGSYAGSPFTEESERLLVTASAV